jgi:hypothetical protein
MSLGLSAVAAGAVGGAGLAGLAGAVAAGAIGGAIGSMVSQGVGVATGLQEKFSWKGVAMAAIAGGVGAGMGGIGAFKDLGGVIAQGAARGAASSIVTQGIGVATGLQDSFSWTSVAVGGVVGGVSAGLGKAMGIDYASRTIESYAKQAVAGLGGAMAGASVRSAITGTSFGDNIMAVLPDVIGSTIGNMVAYGVQSKAQERDVRVAAVGRTADKLVERLGDTAVVEDFRKAAVNAAKNPDSPEARAGMNAAARNMLEANKSDPEVAAFLSHLEAKRGQSTRAEGGPDAITVTGSRDYLFGSTIDNAGIWVGQTSNELAKGLGQYVQDNPGIGIALTIADAAFAVAAPAKFVGGALLDEFKGEASGYIANKMEGPRLWSPEYAQAGGEGFVIAAAVLLTGLAALKSWASPAPSAETGPVEFVDPAQLRWTQTSAGGKGRAAIWRERLDPAGSHNAYPLEPIDVVRNNDGLTTLDHTRAAVSLEYGITNIPARVHLPTDPLPGNMIAIERFGPDARTWGEAAAYRAMTQKPPLPSTGSTTPPRLPQRK